MSYLLDGAIDGTIIAGWRHIMQDTSILPNNHAMLPYQPLTLPSNHVMLPYQPLTLPSHHVMTSGGKQNMAGKTKNH